MKEIVGEKAVVAKDKIYKEIKLGRIAGPFHFPPFPTIRISPISVILKRSSSEYKSLNEFCRDIWLRILIKRLLNICYY
jgi:hypothetical protein